MSWDLVALRDLEQNETVRPFTLVIHILTDVIVWI